MVRCAAWNQVPQDVKSAQIASCVWSDIDTTKVDVGALAPRIQAAQRTIPPGTAEVFHVIRGAHDYYVRTLVWDPFRDFLVSGGGDGWIRLWHLQSLQLAGELDAKL